MKTILPHISIGYDEYECVQLSIEDYELFDYISDYLSEECDIDFESKSQSENAQGEVHTMYFSKELKITDIEKHLNKLKPEYIEEIYALNN